MKSIFVLALMFAAHLSSAAELNLSASDKQKILDASLEQIAAVYVDEHKRESIVSSIRAKNEQTPYHTLASDKFVETLTADLVAPSGDRHLYLRVTAGRHAEPCCQVMAPTISTWKCSPSR